MIFKKTKKSDIKSDDICKIIASIQEGNDEAFSKLFNLCYNEVFGIAMSNVRDYDKACDVTQETFIEIFNTIKSLREPEAFHAWVKKITYHRCTSYFRSKEYKHETLLDESEEINNFFETMEEDRSDFIPEASLDTKELIRIIRDFIKELPEAQRDAVIMYYFNDMSLAEIADVQSVSVETVKSRLFYARKALKKAIEAYEKENDIKLHGIPFIPFLLQALESPEAELSIESATSIAEGVSVATGIPTTVTVGTGTVLSAAASSGIVATIKSLPLVVKIVSVIAAVAVVTTPAIIGITGRNADSSDSLKESSFHESTSEEVTETKAINYTSSVVAQTSDGIEYIDNTWTSSDIILTFESEDTECEFFYRSNAEEDYISCGEQLIISDDGIHDIEIKSVYSNGEEDKNTIKICIDKTAPSVEFIINDMYSPDSLANINVNIVNTDTGVQTQNIQTLEQLYALEAECSQPMYGAPGLSPRSKAILALTAKEWISNSAASITVNCAETGAGISSIEYIVNGVSHISETTDFIINSLPNGQYDIDINVIDNVGNISTITIPIKKDDVPPKTYINCATPNGGAATTPQTVSVKSDYGDTWYVLQATSIPNPNPSPNGLVFDGSSSVEYPPFAPGETYTCEISNKLRVTTYSLAGLAGDVVEYVLYINESSTQTTETTYPLVSNETIPVEDLYVNMTEEEIKEVQQHLASCRNCGNPRDEHHHRFMSDTNCPECGVLVKALECHYCDDYE